MGIPVFYKPEMVAASGGFSPSAAKPAPVVEAWKRWGQIDIMSFEPCTEDQLAAAHDRQFVKDVLSCERNNGHGNRSPRVAASLPYTTGSMVAAAHHALNTGGGAVSPTSGFHHAGYDFSGGFCTFNGLMIAAQSLLRAGVARVGILDFDQHFGNGTENIIEHLGLRHRVLHYTQGAHRMTGRNFIRKLPSILGRFRDCDILLYQAGADPHIDDPLGAFLTTEQLFERDAAVFNFCSEVGLPVAWNLAGGYQPDFSKVIQIHTNTMQAFAESFYF